MIRIVKNIAAIFVLAVFIFTSIGYSISLHYCNQSGDISASFFGKAKCEHKHQIHHSCCETPTEESCSCENHKETGNPEHSEEFSCCVSKTEFFVLNETFISPEPVNIQIPVDYYVLPITLQTNKEEKQNLAKINSLKNSFPDSPEKRTISFICSINSNRSEIPSAS